MSKDSVGEARMKMMLALKQIVQAECLVSQSQEFLDPELQAVVAEKAKKAQEAFDKARDTYLELSKYTLQVFDLKKGELPNVGDIVFMYSERRREWDKVIFDGQAFMDTDMSAFDVEYFHRWTRLPILEDE